MSTPADLQALFASIKPRVSSSNASSTPVSDSGQKQRSQTPLETAPHPPLSSYQPPSVSSPFFSTPAAASPPHHGSDILSPNVSTPRSELSKPLVSTSERASSLLSLLKFTQPTGNSPSPKPQQQNVAPVTGSGKEMENATRDGTQGSTHAIGTSASDLVASVMGRPPASAATVAAPAPGGLSGLQSEENSSQRQGSASPATENAQDMLLRLLNRPRSQPSKSAELIKSVVPPASRGSPSHSHPSRPESRDAQQRGSVRVFGSREMNDEATAFQVEAQPATKGTIFTYVNPFEQLAAVSPRTRTPEEKTVQTGIETSPVEVATEERDKFSDHEAIPPPISILKMPESEADLGAVSLETRPARHPPAPSAEAAKKEPVLRAIEHIAARVDTEANEALAKALYEKSTVGATSGREESWDNIDGAPGEPTQTLRKPKNEVKEKSPEPTIALETTTQQSLERRTPGQEQTSEWISERVVSVYNFPIRPFVSIVWKGAPSQATIREDGFMDIARLKKEFDQLDRSLTSATGEYIVYAMGKTGGIRIIRQDDGVDKQVFRWSQDRIFNVSLCSTSVVSPTSNEEAVLGIGVSGTVYWAPISKPEKDLFAANSLDSESVVIPPLPSGEENSSGGQLKTRAKRSSRHPKFFAISRGKSIHIVWPYAAMSPRYSVSSTGRKVDTEKFFKERCIKIATGKAGKDFVFSDDDSVIVSLDKTGRMRFWDIYEAIQAPPTGNVEGPTATADIRAPILTLMTGSPTAKSWPTSVLFLDKSRPYVKESALRYLLVGLKQNHTLQLWDLALGKAVQELNFPHDNESDAICSVAYHPASGFIVVGHPTRNTIYFVHLSAPRYSLPPMSQSAYIQRIVEKDDRMLKPESTACMSGIRELSFGDRGQLRSLELLPLSKPQNQRGIVEDDEGLFELYVMHSRGVTCLNIKKADLGWSIDNKVVNGVGALQEQLIEINELQGFPSPSDEQSINGDVRKSLSSANGSKKTTSRGTDSSVGLSEEQSLPKKDLLKKKAGEPVPQINESDERVASPEKAEKKKRKKTGTDTAKLNDTIAQDTNLPQTSFEKSASSPANEVTELTTEASALTVPAREAAMARPLASRVLAAAPTSDEINIGISGDFLNKEIKKIERAVSAEFSKSLSRELDSLYRRFDNDRRAQDAAAAAKQDAVLRLISTTLSDNVEKNLSRIIVGNIESSVVPALVNVASSAMHHQINEVLSQQLKSVVPQAVKGVVTEAVSRALQNPDTLRAISNVVVNSVTIHVRNEFANIVRNTITPMLRDEYTGVSQRLAQQIELPIVAHLKEQNTQRQNTDARIEQIARLIEHVSQTVSTMAAAQVKIQDEILQLNRSLASSTKASLTDPATTSTSSKREGQPTPELSPEDAELAEIEQLLAEQRYEEATVKWLQSTQQAELFDNLFMNAGVEYLATLSPLVALSVSAAVTASLETNVNERLTWLSHVFQTIDVKDPDIVEVAPTIIDVLVQRLEGLYMSIAETRPHEPILRRIPPLTRWARDLKAAAL